MNRREILIIIEKIINNFMKLNLILLIACSIMIESKAQTVITLKPNGEVKQYTSGELKEHKDRFTDGNRIVFSDSGQVISETYYKNNKRNGYYKSYENGIMAELGLYQDHVPIGTHYFWNERGGLKKSITYQNGKSIKVKQY